MNKDEEKNRPDISAEKVELTSRKNGLTKQNQNQRHNTIKQAQGPNTKR